MAATSVEPTFQQLEPQIKAALAKTAETNSDAQVEAEVANVKQTTQAALANSSVQADPAKAESAMLQICATQAEAERFIAAPGLVLSSKGLTLDQFLKGAADGATGQASASAAAAARDDVGGPAAAAAAALPAISIDVRIWGFSLHLPHQVVAGVNAGTVGVTALGSMVRVALTSGGGWVATAIGAGSGPAAAVFAAVVIIKVAEFVAADELGGDAGVWVPITWLQVPTLPFPGLAAVWIHPLPGSWNPAG